MKPCFLLETAAVSQANIPMNFFCVSVDQFPFHVQDYLILFFRTPFSLSVPAFEFPPIKDTPTLIRSNGCNWFTATTVTRQPPGDKSKLDTYSSHTMCKQSF